MSRKKFCLSIVLALLVASSGFFLLKKAPKTGSLLSKVPDQKTHERVDFPDIPKTKAAAQDPNERVKAALEKFEAAQAKIPEGAAIEQLAALKEKTAELAKIESPMPAITQEVDEKGIKWKRLAYPSGEIRYELAE